MPSRLTPSPSQSSVKPRWWRSPPDAAAGGAAVGVVHGWAGKARAKNRIGLGPGRRRGSPVTPALEQVEQLSTQGAQPSGLSRSQACVAKAASIHSPAASWLSCQAWARSNCRARCRFSAARAAVTAGWSSAKSARGPAPARADSRHQRSRRSRASSAPPRPAGPRPAPSRWWLTLPTAWPVRCASADAVDGPSTRSASSIRERNGLATAASALASVRCCTRELPMTANIDAQELLAQELLVDTASLWCGTNVHVRSPPLTPARTTRMLSARGTNVYATLPADG